MRKSIWGMRRRYGGRVLAAACSLAAMTAANVRADYVSTITASAPKAWYRFEDADKSNGATALDSASGINGAYRSFMNQTAGPAGIGGQAAAFDGIDSYVDTLAANESQFDFIGSSFSFEAWIQVGAFNKTWQAIAAKGDNSWRFARNGDNNHVSFAANGLAGETGAVNASVNDGQWHHIVAVVDLADNSKREYIDGVMNTEVQFHDGSIDNSDFALFIGENSQARGRYWTGAIDEVAIYDKALTPAQVAAHFAAGGGIQAGSTLPAPILGAPVTTPAPTGRMGQAGVRIARAPYTVSGTAGADAALADPNLKFERYISDGYVDMINMNDPGEGGGGYSNNYPTADRGPSLTIPKVPFPGDRQGAENNMAMNLVGKIVIPTSGDYTFGIDGDDGARLTITGANFTYQAGGGTATGNRVEFAGDTGDAFTLASTFLAAGEYDIQMVWNENGGGAFVEAFAAPGVKTALDGTFRPIGYRGGETFQGGALPTVPAGFSVTEVIRLPINTQQINNLAEARAALDNPEGDDQVFGPTNMSVLNFQDPGFGSANRFGGDVPFLNELPEVDDNDFAQRSIGTLHVETAATYTFGFSSDDGAALTITGGVFDAITAGGGGVAQIINDGQTVAFDANTGDSFTLASITLAPGDYPLEFIMWERGGGASAELFVGPGLKTAVDPTFRLLGVDNFAPNLEMSPGLQLTGPAVGPQGDTNGDGKVDLDDLNNVRNNFGSTGLGDTDGDNDVDLDDLNNVRNNFGAGGANPVPEPSSFALIGMGLAGFFAARRFRKK